MAHTLNVIVEVEYEGSTGPHTQDAVRRGIADQLNLGIDNGFGDGTDSFVIERITVRLRKSE